MLELETRILEIEADDDTGRLARALEAVMELHQPYQYNGEGDGFCEGCSDFDWEISYPCPTVRTITDALEADDEYSTEG